MVTKMVKMTVTEKECRFNMERIQYVTDVKLKLMKTSKTKYTMSLWTLYATDKKAKRYPIARCRTMTEMLNILSGIRKFLLFVPSDRIRINPEHLLSRYDYDLFEVS